MARWAPRLGLVISAALHAALFALLVRQPERSTMTPRLVELEVVRVPKTVLVRPLPAAVEEPPAPRPQPAAKTPAAPPRKREVRKPAAVAQAAASPPVAAEPPQAEPQAARPTAAPSDAPVAAADLPRALNLDLPPRPGPAGGLAVPSEPRGAKQDLVAPSSDAPSPAALIGGQQARRRVENGLVDPYFATLGKALLAAWDAEDHVKQRGLRGWAEQMQENTRLFQQVWRENARRYASAGSPISGDTAVPTIIERTGEVSNAAARDAYGRQLKEQFKSRKRALLRVEQDREGKLVAVTLVEGSNEPAIDREAVADVRAAASRLPPPPSDGLGIKERIVSLWEFQLVISISPPVPTIAFEFDEALGFVDARLPLDRRIYKIVRLVGVE